MDLTNDIHWGNSISLTSHLGGRGYGETIQLGGGGTDHVGSCTGVQGQQALHLGLVGLQGHCSHPRARTPQHRGCQGHPSPCVTGSTVDGHVRQVTTIHQVVSVMWETGCFAEDAGQEGATSR